MRSSNPMLSDRVLNRAGAGDAGGPIVADDRMTIDGVIRSTLILLGLVVAGAVVGWRAVPEPTETSGAQLSGWVIVAALAGFAMVIVAAFRPRLSPVLGPVYALVEGFVVGSISRIYDIEFDGIVLQAVALTVGISFVMLVLYVNETIRATPSFRKGVIGATLAIVGVYLLSIVLRVFGIEFPFLHDSGPLGIAISLVIVGVAALNLILDLDLIERGCKQGWPSYMQWFAALSLVVTLVWLYLELLRLLSKLRD